MPTSLSHYPARLAFLSGAAIVSLLVLGPSLGGSTDPLQDQPPPRPVFKTEANYVRVDVYPTMNGAGVEDLRQEDFEIFEDKAPQKVDAFEHITIRAAGPQETRREPNTVAESRAMMQDPEARLFVVFLDTYHVEVGGSHRIRKPLIDTLNRGIGEHDLVGVMTPEMSARDIAFARRTTTIEGFLTRYWPWGERDQIISKDPEEDQYWACYPGNCPDASGNDSGIAAEMIDRRREKRTIDALEDLVRFLRDLREERKAIIAISDGWLLYRPNPTLARPIACRPPPGTPEIYVGPRTGRLTKDDPSNPGGATMSACDRDRVNLAQIDDEREFRQILDEANRSNASFYPIDPRGLVVFDTQIVPPRGASVAEVPPMVPLTVDQHMLQSRLTALRTLAEATDGIAIVSNNDVEAGMRRVVSDLTSYYLLGYYSSGKLDGKFHSITVRVKRPGIQVRARRGYLAASVAELSARGTTATPVDPGANAEAHAVETAVAKLGVVAREVPMRLQAASGWMDGQTPAFWVVGEMARSDDWLGGGQADVMLVSAAGTTVASARAAIEPGSRSFRVSIRPTDPTPPGEYEIRVRARAAGGGSPENDAVRIGLPPAGDQAGALFVRRGPTTGNKDLPTADVRFRRSDRMLIEIPTASSAEPSARLLDRTGKPMGVPVAAAVREDRDGSRWRTAELTLAPLAPGDYLIEISAGTGGAGGGRRTLIAFRVVP